MIIEKTNERLTWDVSILFATTQTLSAFDALLDPSSNVSLSISYMDGSLALRDAQIVNLSTNASVNLAILTNASLGNLTSVINILNSSTAKYVEYSALGVGLRNASGNLYDFTVIDTSAYLKIGATSWAQWKIETTSLG